MVKPSKFKVSLCLHHPKMNPDVISSGLSLNPQFMYMVGDRRKTPKGNLLEGFNEDSYWTCEMRPSRKEGLADCLRASLSKLERKASFLRKFSATGGHLEFFIGWFVNSNCGEVLDFDPERLADLRIELSFDVYPLTASRGYKTRRGK